MLEVQLRYVFDIFVKLRLQYFYISHFMNRVLLNIFLLLKKLFNFLCRSSWVEDGFGKTDENVVMKIILKFLA